MADVISLAQLEKAALDADTAGEFVSSPNLTTPDQGTPANPDIRTISGINADATAVIDSIQVDGDAAVLNIETEGDAAIDAFNAEADTVINNAIYSIGFMNVGVFGIGETVQNSQETLTYNGEEFNTTAGPFPYTTDGATPSADSADWFNVTLEAIKTVMRSLNLLDSDGIYDTDTVTPIPKIIYSASQQSAYSVPTAAQGELIDNVSGDQLTTDTAAIYKMIKVSHGGSGINKIQNSNFIVNGPSIILTPTPQNLVDLDEVKSGFFCDGAVTGLTYIDGKLDASSGKIYQDVPNTGALEFLTEFTASIADTDLIANVNNVSFSLIGDAYRVVIDFGAGAADVFSVQFETGGKATGHSVQSANKRLSFATIADISGVSVGDYISVDDYATGNNSGILYFRAVADTGQVDDGGKNIFLPTLSLWIRQNLPIILNAKCFGLKGNFTDDDKPQLVKLWDYATTQTTILYPLGQYKIVGGHTHPLKVLHHVGVGEGLGFVPGTAPISGTSFYFPTFVAVTKGGFYMPPPVGSDFSRFSSFSKLSLFGNGPDDNSGNVTCLKINNAGTNLHQVTSRYGAAAAEVNYSVGAHWSDVTLIAATFPAFFVYDAATPYGAELNSVATQNNFESVVCATSRTNVNAVGWNVDATCQYGGNKHGVWDMESCYLGARFEGRVAAKDHDAIPAFGAASWQSSGNKFECAWFERNVGNNMELIFDSGQPEPALAFDILYQDFQKIISQQQSQMTLVTPSGDRPLALSTIKDLSQGQSGTWQSPFTASQFLLHGKEVNSPLLRSIITESIGKNLSNRVTINQKAGYEWSHEKDNVPLGGASVNMANLALFSGTNKSVILDYTISATGNLGTHFAVTGKILIKNDSDAISFENMPSTEQFLPAGTKPISIQPIRVATNTVGLFLFKDVSVGESVNATVSLKYIIGAGSAADRQSILTTFNV